MTRGTTQNFIVAIPVAFFSGLGVAVSLLDDQTSSLVGVAISASLLPPAVNAGIIWIAFLFAGTNVIDSSCGTNSTEAEQGSRTLGSVGFFVAAFDTQERHFFDDCDDHKDQYYRSGVVSLMLTVVNILLIWLSSMLMFRMKEVLPIRKKVFWEDLGVARKVYQNRAMLSSQNYQTSEDSDDNHEEGQV